MSAKSFSMSLRSTEASGTQYLGDDQQLIVQHSRSLIRAYLKRGLTWEDGFSKLPNGMDGLTWSSVLKPFAAVIHDAAIAANPSLAIIV
jgi:hypothetical protein